MIARKMQASKETRDKFLAHRLELVINEWPRMKANDSLECRNYRSAASLHITSRAVAASRSAQSARA